MGQVSSAGTARQKREGKEVDAGAEHGGDNVGRVAAGGGAAAAWTAVAGRCSAPVAVRSRRAEGCQRKKKGGGVRGTHLQN
jgi:hypothetical protein